MKAVVVGAGTIARAYIKVLANLKVETIVVGKGEYNIDTIRQEFPDVTAKSGGLDKWLVDNKPPEYAIVATPIDLLLDNVKKLILSGCKYILAEKPLSYSISQCQELQKLASDHNAKVYVAFNRRNYISVLKAKELIEADGGVRSMHFDFTEAIFRIDESKFSEESLHNWGIANSSHVIDTAFYLAGKPKWMKCEQSGKGVSWHPAGSIFIGMGETENDVPFTYHANWGCPGKWNIEIMTDNRRLFFSPMEKLFEQPKNSFQKELLDLEYDWDLDYKPGFHKQVEELLSVQENSEVNLMNLEGLIQELTYLSEIFGYAK